ncbi:NAD+ synthase [bacterium]|nr:NAD+ synthase [bacterium]
MRIGLLQLNPIVGDISGNTQKLIDAIKSVQADLIVTPEMAICGYPPRDLLVNKEFLQACEESVAKVCQECSNSSNTIVITHPRVDAVTDRMRNSASVLQHGEIIATSDKQLLPSYDVFDEKRYFESGDVPCVFTHGEHTIGIAICEDFWRGFDANVASMYDFNPLDQLVAAGCNIILSPSASPFVTGKREAHLKYASEFSKEFGVSVAVCNQVGGNDDLVFDGGSFVASPSGILGELPVFDSGTLSVELTDKPVDVNDKCAEEERWGALVLGTRDYFVKTGHSTAFLGISGGIDSALVATIATAALGKDAVTGVLMPSRFSSLGSVQDAELLASKIGIQTITLPIEHMHAAFERTLSESCLDVTGVASENAQARIRGLLLMAMANEQGALVLATGNKSELAVGYTTLYGDMDGAISVIGDIHKTDAWPLANWVNANSAGCGFESAPIPESSISKAPSAELRPNQLDQDSLPEYSELDRVLRLHVDCDLGIEEIEEQLNVPTEFIERVVRMVDIAQFKRDQAAVILKTSPRTFGRGRRMPIVMKRSWSSTRETT